MDKDDVEQRISAGVAEVRARIAGGGAPNEPPGGLKEALEAVTDEAIDLLDRVGWLERANDILIRSEPEERLLVLLELFEQNDEDLVRDAARAGVADQHAVSAALLRSVARMLAA